MHGNLLDENFPCKMSLFAPDTQMPRDSLRGNRPIRDEKALWNGAGPRASGVVPESLIYRKFLLSGDIFFQATPACQTLLSRWIACGPIPSLMNPLALSPSTCAGKRRCAMPFKITHAQS
jgi:hypothetical protein